MQLPCSEEGEGPSGLLFSRRASSLTPAPRPLARSCAACERPPKQIVFSLKGCQADSLLVRWAAANLLEPSDEVTLAHSSAGLDASQARGTKERRRKKKTKRNTAGDGRTPRPFAKQEARADSHADPAYLFFPFIPPHRSSSPATSSHTARPPRAPPSPRAAPSAGCPWTRPRTSAWPSTASWRTRRRRTCWLWVPGGAGTCRREEAA